MTRRLRQLQQLLFNPAYASPGAVKQEMLWRYNQETEVNFYEDFNKVGLQTDELNAVKACPGDGRRALVIGCGAGREAFALEKLGYIGVGIDSAKAMIAAAKSQAKSTSFNFQHASLESFKSTEPFDLIFVSPAISGHIQGRKNRISFWQKAKSLMAKNGSLIVIPEYNDLTHSRHYRWAAKILKWRWGNKWEHGDTARSFLGSHNTEERLFFFHYYISEEEFISETISAKLKLTYANDGVYAFCHMWTHIN